MSGKVTEKDEKETQTEAVESDVDSNYELIEEQKYLITKMNDLSN